MLIDDPKDIRVSRLQEEPRFDLGSAMAVLEGLMRCGNEGVSGAPSAWDAAWIACLNTDPAWTFAARREFAAVMDEVRRALREPDSVISLPSACAASASQAFPL